MFLAVTFILYKFVLEKYLKHKYKLFRIWLKTIIIVCSSEYLFWCYLDNTTLKEFLLTVFGRGSFLKDSKKQNAVSKYIIENLKVKSRHSNKNYCKQKINLKKIVNRIWNSRISISIISSFCFCHLTLSGKKEEGRKY